MPITLDPINPAKKKSILFVATVDYHFKAFHLPVMRWFQEQGWEVHVVAHETLELPYCSRQFDIPIKRFPFSVENVHAYRKLKRIVAESNYTLIHCHTPVGGLLGRMAARKARKSGTLVIYTAHGFHFYRGAPFFNWLLYYPIERFLSHFTDCLITITEEDYHLACRHRFPAGKVEHIPGVGVDIDLYAPLAIEEKKMWRSQMQYAPDELLLIYAAEFNSNKNQAMLIRAVAFACKTTPRLKLLLAGDGHLLEECKVLAKKLNVTSQVVFLGYCKNLRYLLPVCDIAVASSRREGLPVNVMEAMACGLPVVASANRGHRELVVDGQTGIIVPYNDHEVMAKVLCDCASSIHALKSMGISGRQRILEKYALSVVKKKITRLYEAL